MPRELDITGRRSGYLTAVRFLRSEEGRVWLIRCDCGITKEMKAKRFTTGEVKSCGCKTSVLMSRASRGIPKPHLRTHGMSKHPAYWVWRSMRDRCRLPTHQAWHNYGGRGITVEDPRWDCFEVFWEDMGPTYRRGLELERVDNSKGYRKANCIWATRQAQTENQRTNRYIDTPWGKVTVAEASRRSGINVSTLLYRLNHGAPACSIFSTPDVSTDLSSRR